MLAALADKYRKSKKDRGTNVIPRRTKLNPSQLYKNYSRNDGDMAQIEAVNQAVFQRCREKGFVTYETEGFSSEIQSIYLVDEKIAGDRALPGDQRTGTSRNLRSGSMWRG